MLVPVPAGRWTAGARGAGARSDHIHPDGAVPRHELAAVRGRAWGGGRTSRRSSRALRPEPRRGHRPSPPRGGTCADRRGRRRRDVGSRGDSYDNALAEAFNSLFKAELVRNKGPWKNIDDLEIAVAEYIDWFNHRRLHGEIGLIPPAEYEDNHYRHNPAPTPVGASVQSLH
jgi:transposase InsO family protein